MKKVLIVYYSSYGHIETMAKSIAEGVQSIGIEAVIKRVPETISEESIRRNNFKTDQIGEIATVEELPDYDAIIVGAPTRFGRLPSQMASFWEKTGGLWTKGALIGKIGAAFTSTATQHGGQEQTLFSLLVSLLHHGMVITGLPYSFAGQSRIDEVTGGSPYGATTIAGSDGSRSVSENEKQGAHFLGAHVATLVKRMNH
ncbi:MAG: NAD(P)H:quinone oxidoreductase [Zymomonas mobilis subsp. pomaceae]|uniref:NAD(P)H dehydrogenase (quinone) n=1 Tax=Zymomonas mobilis subsp. pomaceae (strain ATCC 29192 / DSM 22645 / JCM 10191 / CCUG 17912 / NBRC 13757 / NCIMB 11200 / NRRL B-4491 / Barker I) TaxID=579138 RepID=F8EVB2_ZYMMT|nr:NAD(P)H:quinone oxidoreductase [Zymomonas mobilis]AEI37319.1 flavoprotein WrbA [Zymomonas mobilis subsp. pomaceae ATCC 29192]MDX5948687.1 NAD(P)H:quinone oxidoreductase [Zymomonas mobilis subsp. pomaceae]GEB88492.1 NAD(P)H dehydrogenase (quinone) [Zymomonas mobilis subsp. pomaceae]